MKKLLLTISIALAVYSTSAEVIKFNEESIRQYELQVKYHAVNQLLQQAYKGKITLLDEFNKPLNLKLKADTLWMGAIRYSFEADEYYFNYSAKPKVKSVKKVWVHESTLSDIQVNDKYTVFTFYSGGVWMDKRNQIIIKVKTAELEKLVGKEDLYRLQTQLSFVDVYKRLYKGCIDKTGVAAYSSSSLKTPLNETVLNENYYKPTEQTLMHDDNYPDDPFVLIDTFLDKKVILLIDTENQDAVGFTIDSTHEVWFRREELQNEALSLFLELYSENKEKGYVVDFMRYSGVTPAVFAKTSHCVSGYVDTTNKDEVALMNKIYDIIESDKINTARSFDSLLSYEADIEHSMGLMWQTEIKQVQDPLYPDDPYMIIDTTILTKIPLVYTSYYHINDTLYSIGFTSVGYEQQFARNYERTEGIVFRKRITHFMWLNAYMLKEVLTEDEWILLMRIYNRAKNQ